MNSRKLWLRLSCGLLVILLLVVTVVRPAVTRAAPAAETVLSFIVSNEAPGHLVDWLIAQGHGNDTLLQVLSYLKAQSGGVISDAFYNQVAAAPPGSEVFTARLRNYAGLDGGIEIAADGTINIPNIKAVNYTGRPGYGTQHSQYLQSSFVYAEDAAHTIYTHGQDYGGGLIKNYYAFAIAWKTGDTLTFILSNEAPGHLVDWLIAQGHGNETLFQVLGYLRGQSGGIIPDAWYNQVAAAPPGSEVFTATLSNYAGLVWGIEIAADGTISIPSVAGKDYTGASGFTSAPGQSGQFTLTYTHDAAHTIYTHSNEYGGGVTRDYYAWGIAWKARTALYLPLVRR